MSIYYIFFFYSCAPLVSAGFGPLSCWNVCLPSLEWGSSRRESVPAPEPHLISSNGFDWCCLKGKIWSSPTKCLNMAIKISLPLRWCEVVVLWPVWWHPMHPEGVGDAVSSSIGNVGCEVRPHIRLQCVLAKIPIYSIITSIKRTIILCLCIWYPKKNLINNKSCFLLVARCSFPQLSIRKVQHLKVDNSHSVDNHLIRI